MSSCPVTRFSQACPSRPADAVTVARGGLFAGTAPSSPGLHSPSGSFSASSWLLPPPDSHQGSPQSTGGACGVRRGILFLRFTRVGIGGLWQGMQYGGGLEASGNVVGGAGCPWATPSQGGLTPRREAADPGPGSEGRRMLRGRGRWKESGEKQ